MQNQDPIPALKQHIAQLLVQRVQGWSQTYAADLLGVDQPRLSDLRRGRLRRFSLEQLIRLVGRADGRLHISVDWTEQRGSLFSPVPACSRRPGVSD